MTPAQVGAWLAEVADYCERNRTVRLVYTHPYDLGEHAGVGRLRRGLAGLVRRPRRRARPPAASRCGPMSEYADFLLRVAATDARFMPRGQSACGCS